MPAMSTAVLAVIGSLAPRCGWASSANSGATAPNSANTVYHPSHDVSRPSITSSTVHPTMLMAVIDRPSAIVAQNSHWHPVQSRRRNAMTRIPVNGGISRAVMRSHSRA